MSKEAEKPVRVRFAPAPTGPLHLGGARTALFNWLFARQHKGTFILRIENTDAVRSSEKFEKAILEDLRWLGLSWDEGPDKDGPSGPYRQADRSEIYRKNLKTLREAGRVYPCFCTHEQLEAMKRRQSERGEPPRYAGTCRALDPEERQRRIDQGQRHTWRFAMGEGEYTVRDLIRGDVHFNLADLGDFIIARSDGSFPYLFSSSVDDALMGITHVLRGEDGLSNTPRQASLIEALGYETPQFAHLPLLLDPDGKKLAKRDATFTIESLRDRQIPPKALFRYLAGLGYPPAAAGGLSEGELISTFDLSKISHSPAKVDLAALEHVSSRLLRDLTPAQFAAEARNRLGAAGIKLSEGVVVEEALTGAFQSEVADWTDLERSVSDLLEGWETLTSEARDILEEKDAGDVLRALAGANEDVGQSPDGPPWSGDAVLADLKKSLPKVKGKALYGPVRVSLTGHSHGPELKYLITLLGRERTRERVARALARLHQED